MNVLKQEGKNLCEGKCQLRVHTVFRSCSNIAYSVKCESKQGKSNHQRAPVINAQKSRASVTK